MTKWKFPAQLDFTVTFYVVEYKTADKHHVSLLPYVVQEQCITNQFHT